MTTDLGRAYPPDWSGHPPHISLLDGELWHILRPQLTLGALAVYFDVGLGIGAAAPDDTPENIRRMWLRLTQKRADVILDRAADVVILELRSDAYSNAVGRLLMYARLWRADPPINKPLKLWLATDRNDDDLKALCADMGITYIAPPYPAAGDFG